MNKAAVIKFISSKYFFAACFIVSAALRIAWIIFIDIAPVADSKWFYEKGLDIASGNGYTIQGMPTAYYPAGYSMFLGVIFFVFGSTLLAAKIANILLSLGIIYFSYRIAKKLFNSELTGRITLFALAVYPNFISYSSVLTTEILFLFLLLSGTAIILNAANRNLHIITAGITWGLMCMVKPQGFFIPLIIITALLLSSNFSFRKALKPLLIAYVFMFIVLAPWMARNYFAFNRMFVITSNEGINLLIGNNPYATGEYNLDDKTVSYLWDSSNKYASPEELVQNLPKDEFWTRYGFPDEFEASRKFRDKTADYVFNNPARILALLPMKIWYCFKKGNEGFGIAVPAVSGSPIMKMNSFIYLKKAANYFYYLIMIPAFLYFVRFVYLRYFKRRKTNFPAAGLLIIIYFTALSMVFFGSYRFIFPAMPWIIMYMTAFTEMVILRKKK